MYASRYHCDMAIQIRKYKTLVELVKEPIMEGEVYMALNVNPLTHYEPTAS